jgi:hypothetical protein
MFADQVGKIGGVDAALGAFPNHRQIEHFDEIAALVQYGPRRLQGRDRWR